MQLDPAEIAEYHSFFDFKIDGPFSLLYVLAQRAQLDIMLDKSFTIAIPGLIHLSNNLSISSDFDINAGFDLDASVNVPYKAEGSLSPNFTVKYLQ